MGHLPITKARNVLLKNRASIEGHLMISHISKPQKRPSQFKSGQSLAEFGLLLALVAVIGIGALTTLGDSIKTQLTNLATTISSTNTTAGAASGGCSGSGCGGGRTF